MFGKPAGLQFAFINSLGIVPGKFDEFQKTLINKSFSFVIFCHMPLILPCLLSLRFPLLILSIFSSTLFAVAVCHLHPTACLKK